MSQATTEIRALIAWISDHGRTDSVDVSKILDHLRQREESSVASDHDDFATGAWAMVQFLYDTSGYQFAELIWPGRHPNYIAEKATAWTESPARAISMLDVENRTKLLGAVRQHWLEVTS